MEYTAGRPPFLPPRGPRGQDDCRGRLSRPSQQPRGGEYSTHLASTMQLYLSEYLLEGERKHSRKHPSGWGCRSRRATRSSTLDLSPTLSDTSGLSSSWTFGIFGAPGAPFLRISGTPRRGPSGVTRRRPGAARRTLPAVRPRARRGGRAVPPDPRTMRRRRATWTGPGAPSTPASRQPPPLRDGAVHYPPAPSARRVSARAPHAVPHDGAVAEGGQDHGRVLDIHTERGAGMAAYRLAQGSRGAG